jgi:trans-aconitate methyltransferase
MNPWLLVTPEDYDAHMASPAVAQADVLDFILADDLTRFRPASLAVVGCATGNGFRHIDPQVTRRVVGLDVNPVFLARLRRRHGRRLPGLEVVHADVVRAELPAASFDLVHAALVFEYLPVPTALARLVSWLRPEGVLSAVLQRPSPLSDPVTPTRFRTLRALSSAMELVDVDAFRAAAAGAGLTELETREVPLRQGKSFLLLRYRRPGLSGPA